MAGLFHLSFSSYIHQPCLPAQNICNIWKLDVSTVQFISYFQHVSEAGMSLFLC